MNIIQKSGTLASLSICRTLRLGESLALPWAICSMLLAASCTHMTTAHQMHGGIQYTLHPDTRFVRVEKGKNGSLLYDSPELTMISENGRLQVNGVDAGPVKPGDHVEVTDLQTVLVNGEMRGNNTTGSALNRQRIEQSKLEVKVK